MVKNQQLHRDDVPTLWNLVMSNIDIFCIATMLIFSKTYQLFSFRGTTVEMRNCVSVPFHEVTMQEAECKDEETALGEAGA